jgi:hypothetical protein
LKTTEADLPASLSRLGDELLFHVATNPQVREAIAGDASPAARRPVPGRTTAGRRAAFAVAPAAADARFRRTASPALQARTAGIG